MGDATRRVESDQGSERSNRMFQTPLVSPRRLDFEGTSPTLPVNTDGSRAVDLGDSPPTGSLHKSSSLITKMLKRPVKVVSHSVGASGEKLSDYDKASRYVNDLLRIYSNFQKFTVFFRNLQ